MTQYLFKRITQKMYFSSNNLLKTFRYSILIGILVSAILKSSCFERDSTVTELLKIMNECNFGNSDICHFKLPSRSFNFTYKTKYRNKEYKEQITTDHDWIEKHVHATNIFRIAHTVPPIDIDYKLCKEAQDWAMEMARRSDRKKTLKLRLTRKIYTGENLYGGDKEENISAAKVATKWYLDCYNHSWGINYFNRSSGDFTDLIWKNVDRMGIAKVSSKIFGYQLICARYLPPGNMGYYISFTRNVFPYKGSDNCWPRGQQTDEDESSKDDPSPTTTENPGSKQRQSERKKVNSSGEEFTSTTEETRQQQSEPKKSISSEEKVSPTTEETGRKSAKSTNEHQPATSSDESFDQSPTKDTPKPTDAPLDAATTPSVDKAATSLSPKKPRVTTPEETTQPSSFENGITAGSTPEVEKITEKTKEETKPEAATTHEITSTEAAKVAIEELTPAPPPPPTSPTQPAKKVPPTTTKRATHKRDPFKAVGYGLSGRFVQKIGGFHSKNNTITVGSMRELNDYT